MKSLFHDEGFPLDVDADVHSTQQAINELELHKEFEALTDLGTPVDKVRISRAYFDITRLVVSVHRFM